MILQIYIALPLKLGSGGCCFRNSKFNDSENNSLSLVVLGGVVPIGIKQFDPEVAQASRLT